MSTDPNSSPPSPGHEVVEVLETVIEVIEPGHGIQQYEVVGAEPAHHDAGQHDAGQHVEIIEAFAEPAFDAHGQAADHQVDFVEVFEDHTASDGHPADAGHDAVIYVHDASTDGHHDDYQGDY